MATISALTVPAPDIAHPRSAARRGALTMLPLLPPYISFALVIGSVVAEHGGPASGWAGGWMIFGGSAQLATIRTLADAGPAAAILTGLLINARLVVYSASFARMWSEQPRWFRMVAAALIIDPTWAIAERHVGEHADLGEQRRFFFGAAITLGVVWSTSIAIGAIVGARLDGLDLQIVIPLCLLGLVGAGLRASGTRLVMIAAALAALVTVNWPNGTGLLVAVIAGSMAGLAYEKRSVS